MMLTLGVGCRRSGCRAGLDSAGRPGRRLGLGRSSQRWQHGRGANQARLGGEIAPLGAQSQARAPSSALQGQSPQARDGSSRSHGQGVGCSCAGGPSHPGLFQGARWETILAGKAKRWSLWHCSALAPIATFAMPSLQYLKVPAHNAVPRVATCGGPLASAAWLPELPPAWLAAAMMIMNHTSCDDQGAAWGCSMGGHSGCHHCVGVGVSWQATCVLAGVLGDGPCVGSATHPSTCSLSICLLPSEVCLPCALVGLTAAPVWARWWAESTTTRGFGCGHQPACGMACCSWLQTAVLPPCLPLLPAYYCSLTTRKRSRGLSGLATAWAAGKARQSG